MRACCARLVPWDDPSSSGRGIRRAASLHQQCPKYFQSETRLRAGIRCVATGRAAMASTGSLSCSRPPRRAPSHLRGKNQQFRQRYSSISVFFFFFITQVKELPCIMATENSQCMPKDPPRCEAILGVKQVIRDPHGRLRAPFIREIHGQAGERISHGSVWVSAVAACIRP